MKCINCGCELPDFVKFCVRCGTAVAADNVAAVPEQNMRRGNGYEKTEAVFNTVTTVDKTEMAADETEMISDKTELIADNNFGYDKTELLHDDGNIQNTPDIGNISAQNTAPANVSVPSTKKKRGSSPRKFKSANKKWGSLISGTFSFLMIVATLLVGVMLYVTNNPEAKIGYYTAKAERAYKAGNYEEAISEHEKVISINSNSPESYIGIFEAYYEDGEDEDAIATLYEGYLETGSEDIWKLIKKYAF